MKSLIIYSVMWISCCGLLVGANDPLPLSGSGTALEDVHIVSKDVIDSTKVDKNFIDDYTEHSYVMKADPQGGYADQFIERFFPGLIQSMKVTIVSGNADDVGYVGKILVAPENPLPAYGEVSEVATPVDVTSEVNVLGCSTAVLLLRAKDTRGVEKGWGSSHIPDVRPRLPAKFHWEVNVGPPKK